MTAPVGSSSWDADQDALPGNPFDGDASQTPVPVRSRDPGRARPEHAPRRNRPAPGPEHDEDSLPEAEQAQRRLTSRYGNPAVIRLIQSMSAQQGLQFYLEASSLIDARHLKPTTYDLRVKQTAKNLLAALENRAFLTANGLTGDPARLDAFRRDMVQLLNSQPIRGAEEAYQAIQWTMQVAERDGGIRPATVAIEFVYGATDSLDKYSGFVPALDRSAPSVELEDHIVGVGVEIKPDDQGMFIVHALAGSPAAEAGLQTGDVIESVNGKPLAGMTLEYAVDLITGPAGSRVNLAVRRNQRVADVALVRRRVEVHSVSEAKMLDQQVGYIKLEKFAQNSSDEFDKALWSLHRQGMKSLVVDVRGNPGGLLTTAIELSDKFVPCGTIVATRGRDGADNSSEQAHYEQTWNMPLVVLIDENSASASEIFAAAVQENGRGVIVGRRSYGKGTVQTHFPMKTVSGNLRLTTAQFYSPNGRVMAGAGVEPDWPIDDERNARRGAYEHEVSYRHQPGAEADRCLETAVTVATSRTAAELAQSASARCRGRQSQQGPLGSRDELRN